MLMLYPALELTLGAVPGAAPLLLQPVLMQLLGRIMTGQVGGGGCVRKVWHKTEGSGVQEGELDNGERWAIARWRSQWISILV